MPFDPYDGIGIMDSYFPKAHFFTEFERFDRHVEKLKRSGVTIDYVTVCSPNYLHDAHIRYGLRIGSNVICEKPLVLNPWNIDALIELENEYSNQVNTVLQLRHHQAILELKNKIDQGGGEKTYAIDLTYITSRGNWYYTSWKGDESKSGGIASNIGIHFFDMLQWIFGPMEELVVLTKDTNTGILKFKQAKVNWYLSISADNLPRKRKTKTNQPIVFYLSMERILNLMRFKDLHTVSYQHILAGEGYGLKDAKNAIEIVSQIRNKKI